MEPGQTNPGSVRDDAAGLDGAFTCKPDWGNEGSVGQHVEAFVTDGLNCEYGSGVSFEHEESQPDCPKRTARPAAATGKELEFHSYDLLKLILTRPSLQCGTNRRNLIRRRSPSH